ncbi:MAG TPA: 5-(carboxyamino)imidazole ribonucleotide synthase [Acidobacteriota bacterium]|nr:5-(carboxyamino)imidazole ribonucleotide synthase [Acidobacteriota bacterium]
MSQKSTILPGAAIGVLGSGQLGRMFAIAARRMGYRVHTLSPDTDTPTGQVADLEINASYDDLDAVRNFANGVSVVTFEFENVPAATAQAAAEFAPVRPDGSVLHTAQNRLREKTFLSKNGFPVPRFCKVETESDLRAAVQQTGVPAVLKTAGFGYDGKGQTKIDTPSQVDSLASSLSGTEYILEEFVDFEREVSVIGARGMDGSFTHWGVIENSHRNHILDTSIAPANVPADLAKSAIDITRNIMERLDVIGVLCVEFFVTRKGHLLINELAPRPHNSGHLTFDACVTSQFEQQLRTVCGLPMGSTQLLRPAAMANLLGDLWAKGEPDWARACATPEIKLHLYGKSIPKPGRKMGHLTALADSPQKAADLVRSARQALQK